MLWHQNYFKIITWCKVQKKDFWDIDNARRVEGSNLERPLMFIVLESLCPNDPQLGPLLNGPA